jgi:hypothetical protein
MELLDRIELNRNMVHGKRPLVTHDQDGHHLRCDSHGDGRDAGRLQS